MITTKPDLDCLHCGIDAALLNTFWCFDCLSSFRADVEHDPNDDAARDIMTAQVAQHFTSMHADISALAVAQIVLAALIMPIANPERPHFETLDDALATLCTSAHPSGASDPDFAHASEAGMCARAIQYRVRETPETDPPTPAALVSMKIGSLLHPTIVGAIVGTYARSVVGIEYAWSRFNVSGHADALYQARDGRLIVAEVKTMNTFAFAKSTTPKDEHVLQASVSALALRAEALHVVYVNTSGKRDESPARQFVIDFDTSLQAQATSETTRLGNVQRMSERAPRSTGRVLLDPLATGKFATWQCDYCRYRRQCVKDGE